MRIFVAGLLFVFSTSAWSASAKQTIEQLSHEVSPLWQAMRPVCVMGLNLNFQPAIESRLQFLDARLVAQSLQDGMAPASADRNAAWRHPSWDLRQQLEKNALAVEERESLREYFFKLQTQKPNKIRKQLIEDISFMSEALNLALRKELWKTCHALGGHQMTPAQLEEAIEARWQKQSKAVKAQLKAEMGALYFYAFRQVRDPELAVLSKVAQSLKPWTLDASDTMSQFFVKLRADLLEVPFDVVIEPVSEPSLEDGLDGGLETPSWGGLPE